MAMEQVLKCPGTINELRDGPFGGLMDGFCDSLVEQGFAQVTVCRHLCNVGHLNAYILGNALDSTALSAPTVAEFFRNYRAQARNRGPLDRRLARVKHSINRWVDYLDAAGHFAPQIDTTTRWPLLQSYLKWLREQHHAAPGTVQLRARSIGQFLQWLGPLATPQGCSELTAQSVERFFLDYAKSRGVSARRSMQAALRTFFRCCLQRGYIQQPLDRAVPTIRCYKLAGVARGLSEEQALKLLQCIDQSHAAGRRDYAICQLLHTYGVRGGQVCALRVEDIHWATDEILFRALKHGKDALLPLTREVGQSLLTYLQARPDGQNPQVFLTLRAPYRSIRSSGVLSDMIKRYVQAANIKIPSQGSHAFRHGFATRMLAQGHSLKAIADVLGHRHLGSTLIYTKVDFEHLKQVALPWPGEAL